MKNAYGELKRLSLQGPRRLNTAAALTELAKEIGERMAAVRAAKAGGPFGSRTGTEFGSYLRLVKPGPAGDDE